jgi:hypothetical protein
MGIATANPQAVLAAGSTESAVMPRMTSVTSPMRLATTKSSGVPTLVRDAGQQDDVVERQLALVALPIGMVTTKPTTTPTVIL